MLLAIANFEPCHESGTLQGYGAPHLHNVVDHLQRILA